MATLRERLRYHIKRADPDAARKQYRRSVANRQVLAGQSSDGTVDITGHQLPPHRAVAALNRLDRLARAAKADGDARTLPQLAADAFLDLLEGRPFDHQPTVDESAAAADAAWCDQDHQHEHANGGPTVPANLCSLCHHHHRLRHEHGFVVTRVHTNTVIWDAANRRQYTVLANGTQLLTAVDTNHPHHPTSPTWPSTCSHPNPTSSTTPREGLPSGHPPPRFQTATVEVSA